MTDQRMADRLTSYSDAVVAIASTLLVLPLVDISLGPTSAGLGSVVAAHSNQLFAFVLSFAVITDFWLGHHRAFSALAGCNGAFVWANMVWLLSIVFLPFPTQVIASTGTHDRVATGLYIGTMVVASLSTLAMTVIVSRHPDLLAAPARGTIHSVHAQATATVLVIALVLAVAVPHLGLYPLLLLLVTRPVTRLVNRFRNRTAV